jgi:hypothetical protein
MRGRFTGRRGVLTPETAATENYQSRPVAVFLSMEGMTALLSYAFAEEQHVRFEVRLMEPKDNE